MQKTKEEKLDLMVSSDFEAYANYKNDGKTYTIEEAYKKGLEHMKLKKYKSLSSPLSWKGMDKVN